MVTDYDPIAERYMRAKLHPWRARVEAHTLLGIVGDTAGRSVLDVACGEGFYTRLLRLRGAGRTVGVDLSEGMISLARRQEADEPLGIEYAVGDGRDLPFDREFDLAFAAYLLNYARDRAELAAMCRGLARCLKPGGRFVTVNCCPRLHFPAASSYRKYGFETAVAGPFVEGAAITWTFHLDEGPFSIENYHLDAAAHEEALTAAGFREVRWHPARLAPADADGSDTTDAEYWRDLLDHPPIAFLECIA